MKKYIVAVAGATGAVGQEMIEVLAELDFPIEKLVPLASANSVGKTIKFKGQDIAVKELTDDVFASDGVQIALFSAGGNVSARFAPSAVKAGAVVIDNTSHFRMDTDVPLVVPEVNPLDIANFKQKGIIANPNCSTIQMVTALKPLDDLFNIKRVDIATYQATSGAGAIAMEELLTQMKAYFDGKLDQSLVSKFVHQIAFNVIPQIDSFTDNGYTKEELKMVNETQKILHKQIEVSATCVRVPLLRGHSEALTIKFEKDVDLDLAVKTLAKSPNIVLVDEPEKSIYPMPVNAVGKNEVFVGRIRKDISDSKILHLWVVADNLRVGAATNAVRIAQEFIKSN